MLIRLSPAERSVRRPIRGGKGGYGVRGSTTDLGEGHSLVQAPGGVCQVTCKGQQGKYQTCQLLFEHEQKCDLMIQNPDVVTSFSQNVFIHKHLATLCPVLYGGHWEK